MSYEPGDFRDTELVVHRAGAISNMHVPTLGISADAEWPEGLPADEHAALLLKEGYAVADALTSHLPGGVVDVILRRLLDHRRSMFVVAEPIGDVMARAAAKEMLACLRECRAELDANGPRSMVAQCDTAIAKAEGRS